MHVCRYGVTTFLSLHPLLTLSALFISNFTISKEEGLFVGFDLQKLPSNDVKATYRMRNMTRSRTLDG